MFWSSLRAFTSALCAVALNVRVASGANSFAGSNLYYAAGLYPQGRDTPLECETFFLSFFDVIDAASPTAISKVPDTKSCGCAKLTDCDTGHKWQPIPQSRNYASLQRGRVPL